MSCETGWDQVKDVDTGSFRGLVKIVQLSTQIFFQDGPFSDQQRILGTSTQAQEAVYKAVNFRNFPAPESITPQQYRDLLQASHTKEEMARSHILHHIKEGAQFGLARWEVDVLATSCRVAGAFDQMCLAWREQVQYNPLSQKAQELGLVNQYTVIRPGINGPEEVSYGEAFASPVQKIYEELSELSLRLGYQGGDEESAQMALYFRRYCEALSCTDIEKLPEMWLEVDRAWMGTKGRLQIVASREYGYYDKIRVFPDFRLIYANLENDYAKPVEAMRQAMIKHLSKRFGNNPAYEETKEGMNRVQFFPEGYNVVFAGSLDFEPAGQSLPNEEKPKRTHGVKAFLNPDGIRDRWELALKLVQKVFPKDAWMFDKVDVVMDGVILHTGGHEIGEPLFNSEAVIAGLGPDVFSMLNEDAATLAATVTVNDRVTSGEISDPYRQTQALQLLGVYLRYINMARGVPHLEPYYKGMGLLGLKRMVDSGFLKFQGDELRVNLSAVNTLFELSIRDFKEQVEIADTKNRDRASEYLKPIKNVEALPEVAYLIKRLAS